MPVITEASRRNRISFAIGGIAGLASGLLGVGGGFLMILPQVFWLRTTQREASGTSLTAILPIALVGAGRYYFSNGEPQVDLTVAFYLVIGAIAGVYAGAHGSRFVPERVLKVLLALLLLVVGLKEIHDAIVGTSAVISGTNGGRLQAVQYLLIMLVGLVVGVLSGLTGVGGGVVLVPTMVLGFGIEQRIAQGTSLLAMVPTAAVGALTHYWHGNVDLRVSSRITAAGIPATLVGATLALWLPERILLGIFGLFLITAAYLILPRRGWANVRYSPSGSAVKSDPRGSC